jgi:diketogulonate reductase-like aldo/keto reductase
MLACTAASTGFTAAAIRAAALTATIDAGSRCGSYCKKHGIILQAYASLGGQDAGKKKLEPLGGPLLEHEAVRMAATSHGVSAAQVLLRWALQKVRLDNQMAQRSN